MSPNFRHNITKTVCEDQVSSVSVTMLEAMKNRAERLLQGRNVRGSLLLAGLLAVLSPGCGTRAQPKINGTGSTFVAPMMKKWASEYDQAKSVKVDYESIGSALGVKRLGTGLFDFACTDAPLTNEQFAKARQSGGEIVHIPLVMGAVVPAYNLAEIKDAISLTGPVLAGIFLGEITKWNDKAIQELNPGVALPDRDIAVVHRDDASGTTYIWSDYLAKSSLRWKEKVGVGTSLDWSAGTGQTGNEGVAAQIARTPGSIGYVQLNYALQRNIRFARVINRSGVSVKANLESVTAAAKSALSDIPDDLWYSITDAPGEDAYPISGTVWAILYVKQGGEKGRAVVDFLRWATHEGQEYAAELYYARLPQGLVERLTKKLDQITFDK
jgi:phosphate ABC transporter phosphate-binding protein